MKRNHQSILKNANDLSKEKNEKHVKFEEEVRNNTAYILLAKAKPPKASTLAKLWVRFVEAGNFEQLQEEIKAYQQRGLNLREFFNLYGPEFLSTALNREPLASAFLNVFIAIPKDILTRILIGEQCKFIKDFLNTEALIQKNMLLGEEELKARVEKIKLLLSLGNKEITELLNRELTRENLGAGVKASIEAALKDFSASENHSLQVTL